jgi:hypothetical protein
VAQDDSYSYTLNMKGRGVAHFVCGLRYKLDRQGVEWSVTAGNVMGSDKELVRGERSFMYSVL